MRKSTVLLLIALLVSLAVTGASAEDRAADLFFRNLAEATDQELEEARNMILAEQRSRIRPYIQLEQTELKIVKGKAAQLKATVNDLLDELTVGKFEWSSLDETVVTVNQNGGIKAVSAGTTEIKCACAVSDGTEISAVCMVIVYVPVASIKVDAKSLQIIRGREQVVVPIIAPEDASNQSVSYTVSDESVVSISDSGVITALEPGAFTLTVTALDESGKSVSVKGAVLQDVQEIALESDDVSIPIGKNLLLKPQLLPEKVADKTLIWTSADESIATVNEKGQITAVMLGTTTITAEAVGGNNIMASCSVTVVEPVQTVTLSEKSLDAVVSLEYPVTAEVLPETATNRELRWSSSNEDVAKVDQFGKVTAVGKGNCVITAETVDGSGVKATIKVKASQYDVVMTEPQRSVTLTYETLDMNAGMFMMNWESKNGCVDISGNRGAITLKPVKAGTDVVSVKEREYFSRKSVSQKWTVYVAPTAVGE